MLNLLSVVAALVMSLVTVARVLGAGCEDTNCQSMLYITTTFMSTRRIETSIGWPVSTERASTDMIASPFNPTDTAVKDRAYRFGHYLECMYSARMADKTCPPSLTFPDYTVCMTNTTIVAALDQCAAFPTIGGYYHWPTPEEYLGCLWNNPLLQNSESMRASKNVFRSCLEKSLWPFFEIPQSIDTPVFMGSYNWALLLVSGLIIMTSFGVYTASPWETGSVTRGEASYLMRLGLLWSTVSLAWNAIFFAVFVTIAFRGAGEFQKGGGLPTTASTSFATLLAYGAAVLYYISVVLQARHIKFTAMTFGNRSGMAKIVSVHVSHPTSDGESQRMLLAGTFPQVNTDGVQEKGVFDISDEDVAKYYTPPMLAVWADSYMADVLIVLGAAGATGQLSTDQAWNLTTFTLTYRILNMIISRCMSDAFMNNIRLDDAVNSAKNSIVSRPGMFFNYKEAGGQAAGWKTRGPDHAKSTHNMDVHLNTKIIGLSTQLAALYLYIGLMYLVFNPNSALNDFELFKTFFILCFAVPEALRLLLHLAYQFMYTGDAKGVPWTLYNASFVIWLWDFIFRIIYVCIIILETSGTPGTFDFLKTQTNTVMRDYVAAMVVP
jgi:hypothetical protein